MTITNYTIKQSIGQGGMATVYLAEHNILQKPVAIKILNKEYVHNDNIRKRFLAEARNLFGMSHPNIIKVTDLIDDGDTVAFVMEYMEGETLKEYLERKGKLSDKEIKTLFSQMLDAVGYVHEQNLVHRDIKPSNFMITPQGHIKLLDFGIAKNTDAQSADYTQTGTTQNMGTPMYMSPEQIKSTKTVTLQSDIYSLGVVLWQMVMGKKPYDTNTTSTFELQTKIVTEKLTLTNSPFDSIIVVATAKELNFRYKNCNEIKTKLENLQKQNFESTSNETIRNSDNTITENLADKTFVEVNINKETISHPSSKIPISPSLTNNTSVSVKKESSKKNTIIGVIGIICLLAFFIVWKYTPKQLIGLDDNNINLGKFDYYGTVSGGLPNGNGRATYYSGAIYEGEYKDGLRDGHGIWTYSSGTICEGEFKNNTFYGHFNIIEKNGKTSVVDFISNYPVIGIGNQGWMAENLMNDNFRNGDPIPEAKTDDEWRKAGENGQPAWCYYNNDSFYSNFKLYNWYAINDPRGLAPEGWHIPADEEYRQLINFLGGTEVAGTKMKSSNGWNENDSGANSSGFNGHQGGWRSPTGEFGLNNGFWWSSIEDGDTDAWYMSMSGLSKSAGIFHWQKSAGFSVRCIKN